MAALTADPEAPTRTAAATGLGIVGAYSAEHCKAAVEAGAPLRWHRQRSVCRSRDICSILQAIQQPTTTELKHTIHMHTSRC